ncbi:MAG: RNA polymerase sporulation sigma factor SigK [Oscillospiraceae bacterium]
MLDKLIEALYSQLLYFALHFETGSVFPKPLSAKEERQCFELLRQGDEKAKNKLIEHNLRLVAHIIKKYYSNTRDQDDLISIGTIGLIKAVATFDSTKGTRFATYGSKCVENEILMHFRAQKKSSGDLHFDEPIETDKDGNQLTLIDIISDEEDIPARIEFLVRAEQLYGFIEECLTERERQIIQMRYGLFGKHAMTQREVAAKLKISRSYVSRIEKKALDTLKNRYEGK